MDDGFPVHFIFAVRESASGAERKCWYGALPAAIEGNAENICSSRASLWLTLTGHIAY